AQQFPPVKVTPRNDKTVASENTGAAPVQPPLAAQPAPPTKKLEVTQPPEPMDDATFSRNEMNKPLPNTEFLESRDAAIKKFGTTVLAFDPISKTWGPFGASNASRRKLTAQDLVENNAGLPGPATPQTRQSYAECASNPRCRNLPLQSVVISPAD